MRQHRNRLLRDRHADRARALFTLVAPLPGSLTPGTDMRTTDTGQPDLFGLAASGAVAPLIGRTIDLRQGDVESAKDLPTIPTTRGTRTSTTATRTGTTRATSSGASRSAVRSDAAFSYRALYAAWLDFRRGKGTSTEVLAFEQDLELRLDELHVDLNESTYTPGRAVCFVIESGGKFREVWAAQTRDRVVHHLLYQHVAPRFERAFIADSCACIEGRGTLYAARRAEAMVRSVTRNWSRPGRYLKCDLQNFFVSIHKPTLRHQLGKRIHEPAWMDLAERILFHDPRTDVDIRGDRARLALILPHKSLFNQDADHGLPIGNLSSQFFANVYLDALDQHVKHRLRAPHYIRYVDDFLLLHESAQWLNDAHDQIRAFLPERLGVRLNDAKTIRQPLERGVDFVGQVIKPWRREIRRRTYNAALHRVATLPLAEVHEAATSYLGLCRQATHSHRDRARLANAARLRGFSIDRHLTRVYP